MQTVSALSTGIQLLADSGICFDILKTFSFGSRTDSHPVPAHKRAIILYSLNLVIARTFLESGRIFEMFLASFAVCGVNQLCFTRNNPFASHFQRFAGSYGLLFY